jgi:hypothetical protein
VVKFYFGSRKWQDKDPSDHLRLVGFVPESLRQFPQPPLDAIGLNIVELLTLDSDCPAILATASVGELQDICSIDLVIQQVKAIVGRLLRFRMQRLLKLPNLL